MDTGIKHNRAPFFALYPFQDLAREKCGIFEVEKEPLGLW